MDITIKGIEPKLAKSLCGSLKVNDIEPRPEGLVDLNATIRLNEKLVVSRNMILIFADKKQFQMSRLDFVEVSIL